MAPRTVSRGFLFADLRGYTDYAYRAGNAAAAELLERYRRLVRAEAQRFDGTEIRTEGDSFYLVLPSATVAVECAIAIARAAAASQHAGDRIAVGIGVNAGDTTEGDEGPVGIAVNVAARVCAIARPGEVLVTDTVRHLAHGNLPVRFEPRGRHRLKGVGEPVALYAAVDASDAVPPARPGRRLVLASTLAVGSAVAVLGGVVALLGAGPAATPRGSATASVAAVSVSPTQSPEAELRNAPTPPANAPQRPLALPVGRYVLTRFRPRTEFEIAGPGWTIAAESTDVFELGQFDRGEPVGYVAVGQVQVVFEDPCPQAATRTIEERPRALIEWLLASPYLDVSDPLPVSFAGFTGLEVDVEHRAPPPDSCEPFASDVERERLHLFPVGVTTFKLDPGERVRLIAVDVEGRPLMISIGSYDPARFDAFAEDARPILESIRFSP